MTRRTGNGKWTKRIDKRQVERVAHIKLSPLGHETAEDFRARVRTVAARQEAVNRRRERDAVEEPDDVPRTVSVTISWLADGAGAHVIVDAKG